MNGRWARVICTVFSFPSVCPYFVFLRKNTNFAVKTKQEYGNKSKNQDNGRRYRGASV